MPLSYVNEDSQIVLMLLHERTPDVHRVAEHAKRSASKYSSRRPVTFCLLLRCLKIIREHPVRDEVLDQLHEAGTAAWTRGAHEVFTRRVQT